MINFTGCINYHLERGDVYLIFDRYIGSYSTKQMMRSSRSGNDASRKHQVSLQTTLSTQKVVLTVVHNKVQLINFICNYLINHIHDNQTKLVITGQYPTPVQVWNNCTIQREDLKTNHEEADVIIVHLINIVSSVSWILVPML